MFRSGRNPYLNPGAFRHFDKTRKSRKMTKMTLFQTGFWQSQFWRFCQKDGTLFTGFDVFAEIDVFGHFSDTFLTFQLKWPSLLKAPRKPDTSRTVKTVKFSKLLIETASFEPDWPTVSQKCPEKPRKVTFSWFSRKYHKFTEVPRKPEGLGVA